jgi:hypothetical protein
MPRCRSLPRIFFSCNRYLLYVTPAETARHAYQYLWADDFRDTGRSLQLRAEQAGAPNRSLADALRPDATDQRSVAIAVAVQLSIGGERSG